MAKNEDGEFELILGNRQLLSVFFIVVILLGVFFTMGFIVGRNSSPASPADVASRKDPDTAQGTPFVVEPAQHVSPQATPPERTQKPSAAAIPIKTKPAQTSPLVPVDEPKKQAPPEPAAVASGQPQSGRIYLQIAAVSRGDADMLADVAAKKGFHTMVTPGPNDTLFRVLVGPLKDTAHVSETRDELVKYGLKGREALVRKY